MSRKLSKEQILSLKSRVNDLKVSKRQREQAYAEIKDRMLNPLDEAEFNPQDFDPMKGVEGYDVKRRARYSSTAAIPRRLPTKGLTPKQLLEGQMVGQFESKQDLYLLIAWLSERVSDLEDQLNT